MKTGVLIATGFGILLFAGLVGFVGVGQVARAVGSIGWGGFALLCGFWMLVLGVLGAAWFAGAPGLPPSRLWTFVGGRIVREAAADILPFSQVGGLLIGARTVIARGVPEPVVYAALLVDLATEMMAQAVFVVGGIAGVALTTMRGSAMRDELLWTSLLGLGLMVAGVVAFVLLQRRGVALVGWVAGKWLPEGAGRADAVAMALDDVWERRGRLAVAATLHLLGWVGSGVASWIALRLMGVPLPLWSVLTLESLLSVAKSVGFAVPGALGVQEGAYLLLAPLFGMQPQTALALSLLRRARDIVIGAPTLVLWQAGEGGRLLARMRASGSAPGSG